MNQWLRKQETLQKNLIKINKIEKNDGNELKKSVVEINTFDGKEKIFNELFF